MIFKSLILPLLLFTICPSSYAQIQQAWVTKYNNNGITNGNHQALKMALDSGEQAGKGDPCEVNGGGISGGRLK
jgi:hypothetical protein